MWIEFNFDLVQFILVLGISMFGFIMLGVITEWTRIVQEDLEFQANPNDDLPYSNNL